MIKRPASASIAGPFVLKRPASAIEVVLKRPARAAKEKGVALPEEDALQASFEKFQKNMDVENLVQTQLKKKQRVNSGGAAPMSPGMRPAPTTPRCAPVSPTLPASFASPLGVSSVNMSDLLGASKAAPVKPDSLGTKSAPAQVQRRTKQAPPPPKSWSAPHIQEEEVCLRRRPTIQPPPERRRSSAVGQGPAPSRRDSLSSALFPDESNLDDLLPDADQLRLRSNVPRECYKRAQKRRQSASRDLRLQVGFTPAFPDGTAGGTSSSPQAMRPPASPTRNVPLPRPSDRNRSRAAPSGSRSFECSPSKQIEPPAFAHSPARNLTRAPSWAPLPGDLKTAPIEAKVDAFNGLATPGLTTASRMTEALAEATRIFAVRKARFVSQVEWGFAVLGNPSRDVVSVQKAYRVSMRPLHPDRAGNQPEVAAAVELLREAKDHCERALRHQSPPDRPTRLTVAHLCTEVGRRQFKVQWKAPESRQSAPVHRYIVAVFDPAYGKAISVGTLEPDYSQEYKRFLAFDDPELCSYVLSEEDLRKMPNLFKADVITVQVAAGNNEGQSDWSIVKVRLPAAVRVSSAQTPSRLSIPGPGRASTPGVGLQSAASRADEDREVDRCVEARGGRELESWLQHAKKEQIQGWLKRRYQQYSGSKEIMIQRIITFKEDNPW